MRQVSSAVHGRLTGAILSAACAAALCATPAVARFAPGAIPASSLGNELADRASGAALLSGDGRYVVFSTGAPILLGTPSDPAEYYSSGWVRKDLVTGAIDLVATPERRRRSDGELVEPGVAQTVSGISDDGRYVLVGSAAALVDTVRTSVTPHVYVRDMDGPRNDPSGWELVSAQDGSDAPPRYQDGLAGSTTGVRGFSLSDDGRKAVFATQTESSLPGATGLAMPRWQIFVRDLDARTTTLVTRDMDDATMPGRPVAPGRTSVAPVFAISGDGDAVVWSGSDAARQARFLPGELADSRQPRTHLLWRDVAAGPEAPTRRVAGQADPDDPGCPADALFVQDPAATGPCYGPFALPEELTRNDPVTPTIAGISDDGRRVLFISSGIVRPDTGLTRFGSGFVADMSPGLTRKQGVRVAWSPPPTRQPIMASALAGDGRHVAFISVDTQFDGFQPIGRFQTGDLLTPNVFAADLDARTVERATVAPNGADFSLGSQPAVDRPSVSDDGATVAFEATDGNLFVGDANGASDVLVLRRESAGEGPTRNRELPPAPPPPVVHEPAITPLTSTHAIVGRVRIGRGGIASVVVRAPSAGVLHAQATGSAPRGKGTRASRSMRVGQDRRRVRRPSSVVLRIHPSARARQTLRRAPHRLDVLLRIRFESRGGASRSDQRYTLRDAAKRPSARRAAARRSTRAAHGGGARR